MADRERGRDRFNRLPIAAHASSRARPVARRSTCAKRFVAFDALSVWMRCPGRDIMRNQSASDRTPERRVFSREG
jgi:hypothetical protein